ncbi:MAG: efflux transporter outer membrane subunit [Methylococcales bacterium]|nr:efflux transporter outer membrane subunit [Methylococcales bacterium]
MNKLFILALSALIAGCFKIGPDYIRPQIDTPRQWRFAESNVRQNATNLKWWEQLGDPVLNQLVGQAVQGNLDLKIAIANVEQFMGQYGSTRANLFPQIFGTGNYAHDQPSSGGGDVLNSGANNDEVDFARLGVTMNWELDVWGQLRRANEAARADLLRQEAIKRAVILTLVSQVAQTYITLRELDKNLKITKNIVKSLEEEMRIAKIRFDGGYSSKLELQQVNSEYQRRRAFIPLYEQQIAQTENALSVLLGRNPGTIPRGLSFDELRLPAVPAGLPSDLLAQRPDIQQAEQELIAANARIGVARAQYFPKISLTGDVGQISTQVATLFVPGANFWSVGSALLTPIFTAGKIAGQVQSAEAVQKAAVANYQRSILSGFREFENALVSSNKTKVQKERQSERVAAVQSYFNLSRIRYDGGYTDYLTVLDSIRQLFDAQIDLIQAQSANLTAMIGLYRAIGGGWIVEEEKAANLPKPNDAAFLF